MPLFQSNVSNSKHLSKNEAMCVQKDDLLTFLGFCQSIMLPSTLGKFSEDSLPHFVDFLIIV
jgi:hypothetical protein